MKRKRPDPKPFLAAPISTSAEPAHIQSVWKPAMQQTWKSALRRSVFMVPMPVEKKCWLPLKTSLKLKVVVASCLAITLFTSTLAAQTDPASLPNGVAAGDTTTHSTVLWARSGLPGSVRFEVSLRPNFSGLKIQRLEASHRSGCAGEGTHLRTAAQSDISLSRHGPGWRASHRHFQHRRLAFPSIGPPLRRERRLARGTLALSGFIQRG